MSQDVTGLISWLRSWFDSIYELQTNKTSSWNNTPNNARYPTEKLVKDSLDLKSDFGHGHTIEDITTPMYSSSQIDTLLQNITGDTATDVMDKIGMLYDLRNETVHNITGQIQSYWQGIMEYGLSAILQDYLIDGAEGVYEISNYGNIPTDLFYYYDGNNLTCLTPTKIELSCSDYNPNIDSTVVVTAKLTDMFGNPVPYENLTLEIQSGGGSSVNLITDSNGVATYSYTCSSWGVCRFSIKTSSLFINITGFKLIQSNITYSLYVDESTRTAQVRGDRVGVTINSGNSYEYNDFIIPSKYRPSKNSITLIMRNNQFLSYVFTTGTVGITNLGNQVNNYSFSFINEWHY